MPDTVSDHVVGLLTEWGVDTVFGLPGDGVNGRVEAFRKASSRIATSIAGTKKPPRSPHALTANSPGDWALSFQRQHRVPSVC